MSPGRPKLPPEGFATEPGVPTAHFDPHGERPQVDPRYAVLELLGSGGMAAVWRARDQRLGRDVALKCLHAHVQLSRSARERFMREARVAASLVHENVVQVYDVAAGDSPGYIAMELVEGTTLGAFLDRMGALPGVAVALVGHEVARGLSHAHARGVIHRDVKPENVLISRTGAVKLGDFGIAGVPELARLTSTGAAVGTPAYLSPEQVRGQPADARSDLFALGVILYQMATGRSPFAADSSSAILFRIVEGNFTPAEQVAKVDPDLAAIIHKCLATDPSRRFQSATELADRLHRALRLRRVVDPRGALSRYFTGATSPEARPGMARGAVPRRARWVAVAALAVCLGAGMAVVTSRLFPAGAEKPRPVVTASAPLRPVPAVASAGLRPPAAAPQSPVGTGPSRAPAKTPPVKPPVPARRPGAEPPHLAGKAPVRPRATPTHAVPGFGTVRLLVSGGWADIRVNGTPMGRSPLVRVISLPAGTHQLELSGNPLRRPHHVQLEVLPGKTVEHAVALQPAP